MRGLVVAAAVACAALAACSSNDSGTIDTTATRPSASSTAASSTSTTAFVGATNPVSTPATAGTAQQAVTAVRVGAHGNYDRVVFEFAGNVPGYSVKYVDRPIIADASGNEVTVNGGAVIEVRLEAATAHDIGQRTAGAGSVKEVVKTGDFEAVVHFAVGVASKSPFHVSVVDPNLLIVDVASGG